MPYHHTAWSNLEFHMGGSGGGLGGVWVVNNVFSVALKILNDHVHGGATAVDRGGVFKTPGSVDELLHALERGCSVSRRDEP